MKWDSSRAVPWKRLATEWAVIAVIIAVVSFSTSDNRSPATYVSLLVGGLVYVSVGAILAKFGYQRKTLKQMRAETAAAQSQQSTSHLRTRPAPTRRTAGGQHHRASKRRR